MEAVVSGLVVTLVIVTGETEAQDGDTNLPFTTVLIDMAFVTLVIVIGANDAPNG